MIRYSTNSLASLVNATRNRSTTDSHGHLWASALGPALGVYVAMPSCRVYPHINRLQPACSLSTIRNIFDQVAANHRYL
ncbi:hypothetical protein quinque_008792 [Culex quinquefasciatus]